METQNDDHIKDAVNHLYEALKESRASRSSEKVRQAETHSSDQTLKSIAASVEEHNFWFVLMYVVLFFGFLLLREEIRKLNGSLNTHMIHLRGDIQDMLQQHHAAQDTSRAPSDAGSAADSHFSGPDTMEC